MDKVFVAQHVAKQLWTTEAAIDGALVEASTLMRDMIQGRTDLKLSATFGDEAHVKLMAAMQALTEARTAMVAVHGEMNEAQLRLGLRTRMELLKPVTNSAENEVSLRQVG
jgi:hypothetical protein